MQFEAVGGLPADILRPAGAHAGVVDQHVESVEVGQHAVREPVHLAQVGQIGQPDLGGPAGRPDLLLDFGGAFGRTPVQDQQGVRRGQPQGEGAAQAVGGAGDHDGGRGRRG